MTATTDLTRAERLRSRRHPLRRVPFTLTGAIAILIALSVAAFAFWSYTDTSNGHSAQALAASLSAPTTPTATVNGTTAITVGWTLPVSQLAGAQYQVKRTSGPGSPKTVCTVASNVTSCQDTGLTLTTTYGYSIIAVLFSWQSSAITTSATTAGFSPTLTATGPTNDTLNTAIPLANIASVLSGGSTSPAVTGTITFTVFGPQASAPSTCTTGGTTVGTTTTVNGNNTYNPTAGYTPTATGTYWWYASYNGDSNDNPATSTCSGTMSKTVVTNPVATTPGITAAVTFGSNPTFVNNENLNLTDAPTDSANGTITSVAYSYCAGATGACTNGTPIGSSNTSAGNTWPVTWTAPGLTEGPYRIVAVATDNAGNISPASTATVINVDTTPPTVSRPTVNGHS